MFESLNSNKSTIKDGVNLKELPIVKLNTLVGAKPIKIIGFYISKDKGYGNGCILVSESKQIALPNRYVKKFQELPAEEKDALKSGEWFITNISELKTNRGDTTTFDLVNVKDI